MFLVNNQGTKGITSLQTFFRVIWVKDGKKKSNRKTNSSKPSADFVNTRKLP